MRAYINQTVFDASIERLTWLYQNEENVVVFCSGGKDSTICIELSILVAKALNKLPVKVAFLDQESEYQATVDYMRKLANRPEIELYWFQVPFYLNNTTTLDDNQLWLNCWGEKDENKWIRQREPNSITSLGSLVGERPDFYDCCKVLGDYIFGKDVNHVEVVGMRASESLTRYVLMHKEKTVYKGINWASRGHREGVYRCYPVYDWELSDVWHAIAKYKWAYNHLYDKMFQYGVPNKDMRVSSIIHETGIHGLKYLQEVEPQTFEKLTQRIGGINTYNKLYEKDGYSVKKLPVAFATWIEYRDYLLEHIISDANKPLFKRAFINHTTEEDARADVKALLVNDICLTKVSNDNIRSKLKQRKESGHYGKTVK